MIQSKNSKKSGVSPVLGVVITVVITVFLVTSITVIVFDISNDVSEHPDGYVQLTYTDNQAKATVLYNDNIDKFRLMNKESDDSFIINGDVGNTKKFGVSEGDEIIINAIMDGNEQVIRTDKAKNTGRVSGSIESSNFTLDIDGDSKALTTITTYNYATLSNNKNKYKMELTKRSSNSIDICRNFYPDNSIIKLDPQEDCIKDGVRESMLYSSKSYNRLDVSKSDQAGSFVLIVPNQAGTYYFDLDLIYKPTGNIIDEGTVKVKVL